MASISDLKQIYLLQNLDEQMLERLAPWPRANNTRKRTSSSNRAKRRTTSSCS